MGVAVRDGSCQRTRKGGAGRLALGGTPRDAVTAVPVPPRMTLPVLVALLSTRCGPRLASATRSGALPPRPAPCAPSTAPRPHAGRVSCRRLRRGASGSGRHPRRRGRRRRRPTGMDTAHGTGRRRGSRGSPRRGWPVGTCGAGTTRRGCRPPQPGGWRSRSSGRPSATLTNRWRGPEGCGRLLRGVCATNPQFTSTTQRTVCGQGPWGGRGVLALGRPPPRPPPGLAGGRHGE